MLFLSRKSKVAAHIYTNIRAITKYLASLKWNKSSLDILYMEICPVYRPTGVDLVRGVMKKDSREKFEKGKPTFFDVFRGKNLQ